MNIDKILPMKNTDHCVHLLNKNLFCSLSDPSGMFNAKIAGKTRQRTIEIAPV